MMKKSKNPRIRFKGFTDDWEQRKLNEISNSYSGGTPTANQPEYYGGDIPFIRSAEVNSYKTELFLTDEGLKNSSAKMISKGDILYALYGATSGEVGRARLNGAINQAVLAICPYKEYDVEFIMQWLRKNKLSITNKYLQGGQGNLSASIINELIIELPSYSEQQYVGEVFKALDNLITLHQRKLEKLELMKKSLLQKMFPKSGNVNPKIRFKGYTDDWEQRKFFKIAQRESNIQISSPEFPSVEYEDVIPEVGLLNKDISVKDTKKQGIIFDGSQILYGKLRPYLHNWLNPDFNGVAVGDWWVLKPIETDKDFLYRVIQTSKFDDITKQSSGSKMPRADWNLVANTEFMLPISIAEQKKIGIYFNQLDNLITLHQRKLEKLKLLKKTLLQDMFPSE